LQQCIARRHLSAAVFAVKSDHCAKLHIMVAVSASLSGKTLTRIMYPNRANRAMHTRGGRAAAAVGDG
jgi:hypothetical protein